MKDDYVFPRTSGGAPGMELRDWFAGMALSDIGTLSDECFKDDEEARKMAKLAAKAAYRYADAMIEHRNKEQN